jgi:hypothetical protein
MTYDFVGLGYNEKTNCGHGPNRSYLVMMLTWPFSGEQEED